MWEDCACDFRLHVRERAESDDQFRKMVVKSPALIIRMARDYIIDRARKHGRHEEVSTSEHVNATGAPDECEFTDRHELPGDALSLETFWQEIEDVAGHLPMRSIEFLLRAYHDEQTHGEIAVAAGVPVSVVDNVLSRALKSIRAKCESRDIAGSDLHDFLPPPDIVLLNAGQSREIADCLKNKHRSHDRFSFRESVYR